MQKHIGQRIYELSVLVRLTRSPKRDSEQLNERELLILNLLMFISEPCPVSAIQERLDVPKSMVSTYIKKLEMKQYIKPILSLAEKRDEDRRYRWYDLTTKGEKFVETIRRSRGRAFDNAMKELLKFGPEQLEPLGKILDTSFEVLPAHLLKIVRARMNALARESIDVHPEN